MYVYHWTFAGLPDAISSDDDHSPFSVAFANVMAANRVLDAHEDSERQQQGEDADDNEDDNDDDNDEDNGDRLLMRFRRRLNTRKNRKTISEIIAQNR